MKIKRPMEKRYITILLDSDEHKKLAAVKSVNKLSNRKIFMAMVDALVPPDEGTKCPESETPEGYRFDASENNGIKDEIIPDGVLADQTIIVEEE